jgi:hypothetical protein
MSTLRTNKIENTAGVEQYLAKAWVNFNGTGTVAIRAAGNVSSITDNGAGDYTVNFTVAMADANYAPMVNCGNGADANRFPSLNSMSILAGSFRFGATANGVLTDSLFNSVAIFR